MSHCKNLGFDDLVFSTVYNWPEHHIQAMQYKGPKILGDTQITPNCPMYPLG
jgi:hypothetical protein